MFGLGMMEIGLIIVLAVMLFPPKELPKLARMIARVYGQVRKTAEDFRSAVLDDEDLREPIEEIKGAYNDARWEVRDAERKARQQLAKAQMEMRMATARRIQAEREAKAKAEAEGATGTEGADSATAPANTSDGGSTSAKHVKIAADPEGDDDSQTGPIGSGPVAAADPRVVAARRSGTYTPRAAPPSEATPEPWAPSDHPTSADASGSDEPREGVA